MTDLLLCPRCASLRLQPELQRVSGLCPHCGWRELPRQRSLVPAPPAPPQKGLLACGVGQLWLAGGGGLMSLSPADARWQAFPLPAAWALNGLALAAESLLLSPGEAAALGDPKPLLALDAHSAQILWQAESSGFQWTAPVAAENLVCAVDSLGQVAVRHPRSGDPLWRSDPSLGGFPRRGLPPALSASYLLLVTPQGELRWFSRLSGRESGHFLPPAGGLDCAPLCQEDTAFFYAGEALYRLDLRRNQARELFRAPRCSSQGWFFAAPQMTPRGLLVLCADREESQSAYALRLLDPQSGETRWNFPLPRHPYFAPALANDVIALPDRNGHLLLIDLASGTESLRLRLEESPAAAPLFLDDELFILTETGALWRFSPHLRPEHRPASPAEYLARGDWEAAALKHALQGRLNEAADLYRLHQALPEARALYNLAGNAAARDLLTRQGADFRLRLRSDSPLRAGEYSLLTLQLQNLGGETAHDLHLTCASPQLELPRKSHHFGNLAPGEERAWESLQVRPKDGQHGELLLQLTLTWSAAKGQRRRLRLEQGLAVLREPAPAARQIYIVIGGNVSDSVIVAGDENTVTRS